LDDVPEAGLPPAAVAAASEHDLIEHDAWFLSDAWRMPVMLSADLPGDVGGLESRALRFGLECKA
jgi:hypothetical protein